MGFRLAVRARTSGVSAADVDRALTEERSLVVTWLNRGTLHLIRSEDYPVIRARHSRRRHFDGERAQAGPGGCSAARDVERGIRRIERSLAGEGPLTSDALRERIAATGVRAEGQALYHLLFVAEGVRQDRPRRPGAEIIASGFHPLDALPEGTTAATRDRLAEVLAGAEPGRRLVASGRRSSTTLPMCAPSMWRCAAAASASGKVAVDHRRDPARREQRPDLALAAPRRCAPSPRPAAGAASSR